MAAIRKNTTVMISDESRTDVGSWYIVTGKTISAKGIKKMELQAVGGSRTTFAVLEQVTQAHLLTPEQITRLTDLAATKKAAEEEQSRLFRESLTRRAAEKMAKQQREDAAWDKTVPLVTRTEDYGSGASLTVGTGDSEELGRGLDVSVYIKKGDEYNEVPLGQIKAEVNWSALGSVSPAVARAYARCLLAAADAADSAARILDEQAAKAQQEVTVSE